MPNTDWKTLSLSSSKLSLSAFFLYFYFGGLTWVLLSLQITGEPVGEVKAVADMHQRKAEMARHSDAFIALPGWYKYSKTCHHSY